MVILDLESARCEEHVLEAIGQDASVAFEEFHQTHNIGIEFVEERTDTIEVTRPLDIHAHDTHRISSPHPFIIGSVPNPMICDIHAHLERFEPNELGEVLERASAAGVRDVILNSLERTTFEQLERIKSSYAGAVRLHLAAGFYPLSGLEADLDAGFLEAAELDVERNLAFLEKTKGIVAIGEIGLDFTEGTAESHERDERIFERVLEIARKRDLPVIIHSRRAETRIIEILEAHPDVRAVLHCFTGKKKLVARALERKKTWFSIPVIVEHAEQFQNLVRVVSESRLLTETDAPFLAPKDEDHSEPAHIARTIPIIARLKGLEVRDAELILYENARKLFRLA